MSAMPPASSEMTTKTPNLCGFQPPEKLWPMGGGSIEMDLLNFSDDFFDFFSPFQATIYNHI
jgi:hypothetical protein